MNSKIFVPALIASVLAAVVAIAATADKSAQKQKDGPEKSLAKQTLDIDGSIAAYAREAKARGLQRIVIPSPIVTYDGELAGLDEALADHSLVVAQAIERRSLIVEPNVIRTWYKFKISDTLWKKKPAPLDCKECTLPEPPPEMLPLKHDEILIPEAGGTVIFEGVEVTMVNANFPEYKMAQDYLLVLAERTKEVANVRAGGLGAFTVNADGTVQSIDKKPNAIGQDLKKRYRSSLHELKKQFKENAAAEK
jgi:hypothetical protein